MKKPKAPKTPKLNNFPAKHMNDFCKPQVLTDKKRELKLAPKKYKHKGETE